MSEKDTNKIVRAIEEVSKSLFWVSMWLALIFMFK